MMKIGCAEVDDAHHAEDQGQARGHQRVDAAEREAEDHDLDDVGHSAPRSGRAARLAEIELLDARVREDLRRRPLEQRAAEVEHRAPVRVCSRPTMAFCSTRSTVMPRSPTACAMISNICAHDLRREPERRLVEHDDVRLDDLRARHGEHLLLAAGQRAGMLAGALAQDRELLEHRLDARFQLAACRAARSRPCAGSRARVIFGNSARSCGTKQMPFRRIWSGRRPSMRSPLKRISPSRIGSRPAIAFSSVDLPAPFGPMMHCDLARRTVSVAPFRMAGPRP